LVDNTVVIPLAWRVSAQDAIATVARAKVWSRWDLQDANLRVWYTDWLPDGNPGRQALLWRVTLINPERGIPSERYAVADVDAVTGRIVEFMVYGGQPPAPNKKAKEQLRKLLEKLPNPKQPFKVAPPTIFQQARQNKVGP
jgi:hypothetical protein